jgi:hypothetical protein
MSIHTLGTKGTTSLNAITWNPSPGILLPADCAAIYESIVGDKHAGATNPTGIVATGTTHGTTTLDTLVAVSGAPLAAIKVGQLVLGVGITPGTFVAAILSSTSVQLSQAATGSAAGVNILIVPLEDPQNTGLIIGQLRMPGGRGTLNLKTGDVVAIDNTGWPIVISATAIAYAGSLWSYI